MSIFDAATLRALSKSALGKALVYDFGECNDLYCQLYKGNDESRIGTVVSVYNKSLPKYRVIGRYSKNTLLILFK